MGIYYVRAGGGRVWSVIAESAAEAARLVGDQMADFAQIDRTSVKGDDYEVGRIGTYEPGITGAALVQAVGQVVG